MALFHMAFVNVDPMILSLPFSGGPLPLVEQLVGSNSVNTEVQPPSLQMEYP